MTDSTKKPFPNHTINAELLINPCIESLKFAYEFKRINKGKDIPYNGYSTTLNKHICLEEKDRLKVEHLDWHGFKHDKALEEIISIIFSLGFEQGVNHEREKNYTAINFAKSLLDAVEIIGSGKSND